MDPLVVAHAVAGTLALLSMWVPLFARKGGRAHRIGGRVYVAAMLGVVILALIVCAQRLTDGVPGNDEMAWFLSLIAVLAGSSTWFGWATSAQRRTVQSYHWWIPIAALGAGAAGVVFGVMRGVPLVIVFGALTLALAWAQLAVLRRGWPAGRARIGEHLGAMIAACISTITAFAVVNQGLVPSIVRPWLPPMVVWLLPTMVGVPFIVILRGRYR